jgi:hypothetical protein
MAHPPISPAAWSNPPLPNCPVFGGHSISTDQNHPSRRNAQKEPELHYCRKASDPGQRWQQSFHLEVGVKVRYGGTALPAHSSARRAMLGGAPRRVTPEESRAGAMADLSSFRGPGEAQVWICLLTREGERQMRRELAGVRRLGHPRYPAIPVAPAHHSSLRKPGPHRTHPDRVSVRSFHDSLCQVATIVKDPTDPTPRPLHRSILITRQDSPP